MVKKHTAKAAEVEAATSAKQEAMERARREEDIISGGYEGDSEEDFEFEHENIPDIVSRHSNRGTESIDSDFEESEPPDPGTTPLVSECEDDDWETLPTPSRIENVKLTQSFIELIKNATLDNGKMDPCATERLRNPPTEPVDLSDPDLRFSLDLYLSCMNSSEATYNQVRQSVLRRFPDMNILSYHLAKKEVAEISGVMSVLDDMCINSCHAFTGPFEDLDACTICSEPRYSYVSSGHSQKRAPQKQMISFPIGSQIQALRRSIRGENDASYRARKVAQILKDFEELLDPTEAVFDDIFCGEDLRDLLEQLNLTDDDMTAILSFDGAQLYQNKKSDTWIAIFIITEFHPNMRNKSKHTLPAMIIPGPNKCKVMDSCLYRTLHHLSAIQREDGGARIKIYDAAKDAVVSSQTIFLFALSDVPGLVEVDGRVGHHGTHRCREGCPMKGWHKPSSGHYYAAHLKPNLCDIEDCNHEDFNLRDFVFQLSPEEYNNKLTLVIESIDQNSYEKNRKLTGISKPSILSGLHPDYILSIPRCFTNDIMHLITINLGELFIPVWCGTFKCESTDDKATWDWATLVGDTWQSHGKLVAAATKYFPSFFHRPPRNPAEKISSGYKASEYYLYLFGLGPGFFRAVLPKKYWKNFCKLVCGVHIIMQRRITGKQAQEAHSYLVQFVEEYEHIYYQRRMDWLHFATEPANTTYGNLSQLALWRAQASALKAVCPELDDDVPQLPQYAQDLGAGYVLLRPREKMASKFSKVELEVTKQVCNKERRQKWGHLQLPNGQTARSLFSETRHIEESTRISCNVKITLDGQVQYAEVQYFFFDRDSDEPGEQVAHAVLSLYGPPNEEMLVESSYTLHACKYTGQENLLCLPITAIDSVVLMQPLPRLPGDPENLWFVVEKSGLNDVQLIPYGGDVDN
ncbi:hypothetical protein K443DRAFT_133885 [Laccaria amethystina LaAM-08-1]|uniref:Uncharacterized protein n=1 Tax=Laccaria amethystina LaAM-08-1 TaxID=1095629 RepID=A0A0C9X7A2_9AGAR|nr:hypothetical protein K443DRAFT_133885 [Laccaria amethystina LaAM-08-1]